MRLSVGSALSLLAVVSASNFASGVTVSASDVSGLAAEAEFSITGPTQLTIRLRNTSTGVPMGWTGAATILTGVSWDFGTPGVNPGDISIHSGSVLIGPNGQSLNFSSGSYGAGADVSGEWGFGNGPSGASLPNFVSALQAGSTQFSGTNLDGPSNLSGPQGGLVANPLAASLGGQGGIQDEVIATLVLNQPIADLTFLTNSVRFEFGSDALFLSVPAPSAAAGLFFGGLLATRRRR